MNQLEGNIKAIQTHKGLSLVTITVGNYTLKSIILETPQSAPYLIEGHVIRVLFKETEVLLAKAQPLAISSRNQIYGHIIEIDKGVILSEVILKTSVGTLKSIITTEAVASLNLNIGDKLTALVKTNEIMLAE